METTETTRKSIADANVTSLEARVNQLENYFKIGVGIALILGVGGGYLGTLISNALGTAKEATNIAQNAEHGLSVATDEAVARVQREAVTAVKAAVAQDVPGAVNDAFKTLSNRIRLSLGPEHHIDYRKIQAGQSFDHKCPEGMVATGWGYGHTSNDVRFWCKPISVAAN